MPFGSRQWWAKSGVMLGKTPAICSIPAMKNDDATWIIDARGKATLLAKSMSEKCRLPVRESNKYSKLSNLRRRETQDLMFPILETSLKVLKLLDPGSGTGPDELPARILKECAEELALPITILVMRILAHGKWPNIWRVHWIIPLYKRAAVYKSKNYRGVHMTPQISKAVERVLKTMIEPHLERIGALGDNQFAYRKGRGSRDLILMLMLEWMSILDRRGKI